MILLQPAELRDAPAVLAAVDCSREALGRWMVWYRDSYALTDAESWLRYAITERDNGTGYHFTIRETDGRVVGVLSLEGLSDTGRAMLGYWVATPATGRGVATTAVRQALAWARAHSAIHRVWALVAKANARSRRVVEVNGFQESGVREVAGGEPHVIYELALRPEQLPNESTEARLS
jgi:ribosomal-protein-serine acetyltransferase